MNLARLLEINELNRNSYNTLWRRAGGLPFMPTAEEAGGAQDRYDIGHSVALGCMLEFMRCGVQSDRAARAVGEQEKHIRTVLTDYLAGRRPTLLMHLVNLSDGTVCTATSSAGSFRIDRVGKSSQALVMSMVSVDIGSVAQVQQRRWSEAEATAVMSAAA